MLIFISISRLKQNSQEKYLCRISILCYYKIYRVKELQKGQIMIAYCGIDCSKCNEYTATKSGDIAELTRIAKELTATNKYSLAITPEQVVCDGCKSKKRISFRCGDSCKIKTCCTNKQIKYCIECSKYPCTDLKAVFKQMPDAKKNLENLK